MKDIKFVELFAGIGGFRLGLTNSSSRYKCVYANEIDSKPANIYRNRFWERNEEDNLFVGDIRNVRAESIQKHDLLCGGFPCQTFSIIGQRRGFEDTRGTLFFEICRIIQFHRTKYLFLENVKGLLNHDNGRTFGTILRSLDELGYDSQWQVCNSKDFGTPQSRERIYIIGYLRGEPKPKIFPITESCKWSYQGWILQSKWKLSSSISEDRKSRLVSNTITADYGNNRSSPMLQVEDKIRELTPLELERLQCFPDNWTEGLPTMNRYHALGNAVNTIVIQSIGELLAQQILL